MRRALLIVDVEPHFLTPATRKALPALLGVIHEGRYAAYVLAEYGDGHAKKHAMKKTQWERAFGKLHASEETVPEIEEALAGKPVIRIAKSSRSLFGSDDKLAIALRRRGIREVHVAGFETHDCVLATAFDAYDHNFTTYVLPIACASKKPARHRAACAILNDANLLRTPRVVASKASLRIR